MNSRAISAIITSIIAIAVVLMLVMVRLGFSPADMQQWPPADTTGLLMADEYVEVEQLPPPVVRGGGASEPDNGAAPPPPDANDLHDAGHAADQVTPIRTSTQPSPVVEKEREPQKPTGPTQEELEAQAREKRQKDASLEANNRMRFGTTPAAEGSGTGDTGTGDGNSSKKGNYTGTGSGNVGGRGVSVGSVVSCPMPGTVTVRITVNPEGRVTKAEVITPTTIGDTAVRERCRALALAAKVAPAPGKTSDEIGRITFSFK